MFEKPLILLYQPEDSLTIIIFQTKYFKNSVNKLDGLFLKQILGAYRERIIESIFLIDWLGSSLGRGLSKFIWFTRGGVRKFTWLTRWGGGAEVRIKWREFVRFLVIIGNVFRIWKAHGGGGHNIYLAH